MQNLNNTDNNTVANGLYNGNIASMFVNIPKLGDPQLYGYKYDQLNRLVSMDVFKGFNNNLNQWTSAPVAATEYKERISYDANGNVLTGLRNGGTSQIGLENFSYTYGSSNQVQKIINNNPQNLVPAVNTKYMYAYDQIGNATKDELEGNKVITWTVYGKMKTIEKSDGNFIVYDYDAAGNRISENNRSAGIATYSVYDASGNTMATYEKTEGVNLLQKDVNMYGSKLLGVYHAKAVLPAKLCLCGVKRNTTLRTT